MSRTISIVVCTHNRANSLVDTLTSLARLESADGHEYELVVVDNNSSDNTREVVETCAASAPFELTYVHEAKQGHSYARNAGIASARGSVVLFTDDDVIVDPCWAKTLAAALETANADCVGGRILPLWERQPPAWLEREFWHNGLWKMLAMQHLGDADLDLSMPLLWGANFGFKAESLRRVGGFDVQRGRVGGRLTSGDDTDIQARVLANGGRIRYVAAAAVLHKVPAERMQMAYFERWQRDAGRAVGRESGHNGRRVAGRLLARYRALCTWYGRGLFLNPLSREAIAQRLRLAYLEGLEIGIAEAQAIG